MNTETDTETVDTGVNDLSGDANILNEFPEIEVHESEDSQETISHIKIGGFMPLQKGLTPNGKIDNPVRFDGRVNPFTPFNNHGSHHNQRSIVEDGSAISRDLSTGRESSAATLSRKGAGMIKKWSDNHSPVLRSPRLAMSKPASLPVTKPPLPRKTGGRKKVAKKVTEFFTPEEQRRRQILIAEAQIQLDKELLEKHVLKIETATEGFVGLLETLKASEETKERIRKCMSALYDAFHKPDA